MLDHEEQFLFKEELTTSRRPWPSRGARQRRGPADRRDDEPALRLRGLHPRALAAGDARRPCRLDARRPADRQPGGLRGGRRGAHPPEVHERLVAWRARFGLAIDNALNFLNNPDGIQGHNFSTQVAHVDDRRVLQGRLTLVRYNNEPQFFIADADVLLSVAADMLERLGEHLEPDMIDAELVTRLREGVELIERRTKPRA
jgi:hypothetical protein